MGIRRASKPARIILRTLGAAALCVLLFAASLCVIGRRHVYRGSKIDPPAWDPGIDRRAVVAEARKLVGVWYDPLQGYLDNLGGRLGLIVCSDVPVIAYRNAGSSIQRLLEDDYNADPGHYGEGDGRPGDPYFARRARNLYAYCKYNGRLVLDGPPLPGDMVFMSHSLTGQIQHIALVSNVEPGGRYRAVEASPGNRYSTRELDGDVMLSRGWIFRGFGRLLDG